MGSNVSSLAELLGAIRLTQVRSRTTDTPDHRPSGNVSGTAVSDRDPPIRDYFSKKTEKRSARATRLARAILKRLNASGRRPRVKRAGNKTGALNTRRILQMS
jgi:hypothetical protein